MSSFLTLWIWKVLVFHGTFQHTVCLRVQDHEAVIQLLLCPLALVLVRFSREVSLKRYQLVFLWADGWRNPGPLHLLAQVRGRGLSSLRWVAVYSSSSFTVRGRDVEILLPNHVALDEHLLGYVFGVDIYWALAGPEVVGWDGFFSHGGRQNSRAHDAYALVTLLTGCTWNKASSFTRYSFIAYEVTEVRLIESSDTCPDLGFQVSLVQRILDWKGRWRNHFVSCANKILIRKSHSRACD